MRILVASAKMGTMCQAILALFAQLGVQSAILGLGAQPVIVGISQFQEDVHENKLII